MDYEKAYKDALERMKGYVKDEYGCTRLRPENIFPELAESDDDRIRNLIYCLIRDRSDNRKLLENNGCSIEKALDWLEKQKPSKAFIVEKDKWYVCIKNFEMSDGSCAYIQGHLYKGDGRGCLQNEQGCWFGFWENSGEKYFRLATNKELIKKQDKQKPADKVEPFDKYKGLTDFERTLADICIGWIGEELGWEQYIKDNADVLLKIAIKKFNSVQDAPFEQKPAWSEDDEKMLANIICSVNACDALDETISISLEKHKKKILWLKSLKDRVQLQPKQEWTDVDRDILFHTIDDLEFLRNVISKDPKYAVNIIDIEREITWLKSLRPQNTWKPSDEQMDALQYVYRNCNPLPSDKLGWDSIRTLELMYQDLKKLSDK